MGKYRDHLRAENRQYRRLLKDMKKQLEGQRKSLNRLQSMESQYKLAKDEVVLLEHTLYALEEDYADYYKKGHWYPPEFFLPETKEFNFSQIITQEEMWHFGKNRCTLIAKENMLGKLADVLEKNGMIQFKLRNQGNDFVYMGRMSVVVPEPEFPKKKKELI